MPDQAGLGDREEEYHSIHYMCQLIYREFTHFLLQSSSATGFKSVPASETASAQSSAELTASTPTATVTPVGAETPAPQPAETTRSAPQATSADSSSNRS